MDLDPFTPIGIAASTVRFLDVFLLHCWLAESPPDTPEEIAALARNQERVAARGRESGLQIERAGRAVGLADWGGQLLEECAPVAAALDAAHGGRDYSDSLRSARVAWRDTTQLPSARLLAVMSKNFEGDYLRCIRALSEQVKREVLEGPLSAEVAARLQQGAAASIKEQAAIEAADSLPFETFRQQYISPQRLWPSS